MSSKVRQAQLKVPIRKSHNGSIGFFSLRSTSTKAAASTTAAARKPSSRGDCQPQSLAWMRA
ncbi:hypothetical protein D3C81_2210180 [compost metagenome]